MRLAVCLFVASLLCTAPAAAQPAACHAVESATPREAVIPGVARVRVMDETPPSHGVTGAWSARLQVQNTSGDWLRIELLDFELVREGHASAFGRPRLEFLGGGRAHRGRRIRVPPGFEGEVRIEGRPRRGQILHHVDQWHRVGLRLGAHSVQLRGCALRYRFPRHRR